MAGARRATSRGGADPPSDSLALAEAETAVPAGSAGVAQFYVEPESLEVSVREVVTGGLGQEPRAEPAAAVAGRDVEMVEEGFSVDAAEGGQAPDARAAAQEEETGRAAAGGAAEK